MEARDLRVGNLVSYENAEFNVCKVQTVFLTHFRATNIDTGVCYGNSLRINYKPIPLSEEWLLKFGFEKSSPYWIKASSGFYFGIFPDGNLMYLFSEELMTPIKCKHVHQLQNLYFALTGQELTLNE